MKTASQFAEEISAITAELPGDDGDDGAAAQGEPAPVAEEIADWRGPLQDIQVRLRRMIQQDIDKFMESAQKILQDAESSDWSPTVVQNSVARWSRDINRVYADFVNSTKGFQNLVKAMGIPTRRHSTKGKAPGKRGKMDWKGLSQTQLKKEVRDQVKRLSGGIHSLADDGSFMLHQIDRILKYKAPKDDTVREEIGALFQDFVDFRNAFGSKVWGPYKGLIGRLEAIPAKPISKYGKEYGKTMRKRPMKTMPPTPQVAHSELPIDCPELREAIERDHLRATRGVLGEDQEEAQALIEGIEAELLGEEAEEKGERGVAKKMKAKGYKFKILLKDKPPLYAKTEKGAKDVQKDWPGSKIVANESEEIDDPAVIEAAEHGSLFDFFEDFDSLFDEEPLDEGDSDSDPFPLSEDDLDAVAEEVIAHLSDEVFESLDNDDDLTVQQYEEIVAVLEEIVLVQEGRGRGGKVPLFPPTKTKKQITKEKRAERYRKATPKKKVKLAIKAVQRTGKKLKRGMKMVFGKLVKAVKGGKEEATDRMVYVEDTDDAPFPLSEATEFEKGVRVADGPSRQKMAIQQIFGFLRLKGDVEPGAGGKFMHGVARVPGGHLEFDADRTRLAWTAFANGSIVDKGHSPYGGSINRMTKPIVAAMKKVAATTEGCDPVADFVASRERKSLSL